MSSQLCVCFFLEQCCTYGIDGHSGFIVVHTAQNQIHRLPFLQPSITEKTESFVVKACNPLRREQSQTRKLESRKCSPDALHKMCKIVHCGDVVVVALK